MNKTLTFYRHKILNAKTKTKDGNTNLEVRV